MFYPYTEKQTLIQWILNTIDPRVWRYKNDICECSWQYLGKNLLWVALGGCPYHD